ncbi:MAG: hypothetical protein ACRDNZ_17640 [Streptosporangiaceae bacterium]
MAGFEHELCIELDPNACATLRHNRRTGKSPRGCPQPGCLEPAAYAGTDVLPGGVLCLPFTVTGMHLGATDERDLFA